MATRYNINDFALANPAYAGGTVSFYTVSGGAKTTTLATRYAASTGSTTLANPRTLDSDGKFSVPVYVEVPTVATVSGLTVADHDTGIMGLAEGAAATSAAAAAVSAAAALVSQLAAAASAAAVLGQFAASAGASLIGWIQAGVGAVARTVQAKLRDQVSVKDFGATGDGATNDVAAIQAALDSGAKRVVFPDGNYLVSSYLTLPVLATLQIDFSAGAWILAGANNVKVFKSTVSAYGTVINNPQIDGNGKTGVTAFEFVNFAARCAIANPYIKDCNTGIYLKQLCVGASIIAPYISNTANPIIIKDGSNCVSILNPQIDSDGSGSNGGAATAGIAVVAGPTYDAVSARIIGGYVQGFKYGVSDSLCWGTNIDGTYFERNPTADIYLVDCKMPKVQDTMHLAAIGAVCVLATGTYGTRVINPILGAGGRSLGLFNFDGTNSDAQYEIGEGASINAALGTVTGINPLPKVEYGTFTPVVVGATSAGAGTYSYQNGIYRKIGKIFEFNITLIWSAHTGTGVLTVTGLPASAAVPVNTVPVFHVNPEIPFTGPVIFMAFNGTGTNLSTYEVSAAGTKTLVTITAGAGRLDIHGSYCLE